MAEKCLYDNNPKDYTPFRWDDRKPGTVYDLRGNHVKSDHAPSDLEEFRRQNFPVRQLESSGNIGYRFTKTGGARPAYSTYLRKGLRSLKKGVKWVAIAVPAVLGISWFLLHCYGSSPVPENFQKESGYSDTNRGQPQEFSVQYYIRGKPVFIPIPSPTPEDSDLVKLLEKSQEGIAHTRDSIDSK